MARDGRMARGRQHVRECDDLEDAARAIGPAPSHAPALMACAAAAALVLAGGVTVVVMRVRNDDSEPEGLNWWFVAWFVVGLTYAVVGAALLTRARGRILGVCFIVIGAAATATAIATQYPGIADGDDAGWPGLLTAERWTWPLCAWTLA